MAYLSDVRGASVLVQGAVKNLCKEDLAEDVVTAKVEKSLQLVAELPMLDLGRHDHRAVHSMLESSAVGLWNHAVALKTKGELSPNSNANLRHVSCLLEQKCNGSSQTEQALKKIIMMTLKTARIWLDCEKAEKAIVMLDITFQSVQRIQCLLKQKSSNKDAAMEKVELEKDHLKLFCYKAEAAVMKKDHVAAMGYVKAAKEIVMIVQKEGSFLSMMCYNFGVEAYTKRNYKECVSWLRESYEIGKDRTEITSQNQGRTLRLLANAYLELDEESHIQDALNTITLANSVHPHPAGLLLSLKVLLLSKESEERIKSAAKELLSLPDLTLEFGLHAVSLLSTGDRKQIAVEVVEDLKQKFEKNAQLGSLLILQLQLLLQGGREEEAKVYMEEIITDNSSEKPLDLETKKRFQLIIWEQAARTFEENCYSHALDWYNYSLSLYSSELLSDLNLAKLHRNRATCHLNLNQPEKAREALSEAEKLDGDSPQTQFVIFKLALATTDTEKAQDCLKKLCAKAKEHKTDSVLSGSHSELICLAAHLALETKNVEIGITALECLIQSDCVTSLTAHRCLVRLEIGTSKESSMDRSGRLRIKGHLQSALQMLQSSKMKVLETGYIEKEAAWFMKIAWNLALQCDDQNPDEMRDFFKLCLQFTALCPEDVACLSRQKICILMVAAAGLQQGRLIQDIQEKTGLLQEVLIYIADCKRIQDKLKDKQSSASTDVKKDTSEILLLLYEFEAKTKLGDSDVEDVLEKALALPFSEPKLYETMAALAMEPPAKHRKVSLRALKAAIRKHLQMESIDINKLSKAFHSLIELSLQPGLLTDSNSNEEALSYYTEVLEVLEKKSLSSYPEMEALWLMTKAWNQGIYIYSAGRYAEAEKWCGMSLKFLRHLQSMKSCYEEQMTRVYSEILLKIEREGDSKMEE